MVRRMIVRREDGSFPVLVEVDAHDEAELQSRMKEQPELLPLDEFGLDGPLLVVGRETTLPSGAADLLCLTRNGEVLVIEFKTGPQNPDFRAALAQVLDYGSDLWQMSLDVFEQTVAVRYFQSTHCTYTFKGITSLQGAATVAWPTLTSDEAAGFADHLSENLRTGAFHYVVVAQRFTPAMNQTGTYLNALNSRARFYLVELVRFTGDDLVAYEARTILKPLPISHKAGSGASLSEQVFLDTILEEDIRQQYADLFEVAQGLSLRFEWGSKGTSIRLQTPDKSEPVSVAWVFPPGVIGWMGLTGLTFGFDPAQAAGAPSAHAALDRYVEAIGAVPGGQRVGKAGLKAYAFDPRHFGSARPQIVELLADVVSVVAGHNDEDR